MSFTLMLEYQRVGETFHPDAIPRDPSIQSHSSELKSPFFFALKISRLFVGNIPIQKNDRFIGTNIIL